MTIPELAAELKMDSPGEILTMISRCGIQPDDFFLSARSFELSPAGEALIRRFALEQDQLDRVAEISRFRDEMQNLTERSLRLANIVDLYLDTYTANLQKE